MPKVFIVIINFNGWKDTIECLWSLNALYYQNLKIIIVDNGSSDDSVSRIESGLKANLSELSSKIKLIENQENLGFSGGNNVGIKYALEKSAEYVLLLNNDTVVEPNFLKELVEVGEQNKKYGILGPKIHHYNEPQKIWSAGGKMNWFTGNSHLDFNQKESGELASHPKSVEYISGCSMLIKKEVFEKVGLLYEPYFLYYEDVDFCLRAKKAKYDCVLVPQSIILHKVSSSTKKLGNPIFHYYNHRNILLLAKRNRPLFFYYVMVLWSVWKFTKQLPKLILLPQSRQISLAIMQGIIDFYKGQFGAFNKRTMNNEQ